jgi:hypothetical protein
VKNQEKEPEDEVKKKETGARRKRQTIKKDRW